MKRKYYETFYILSCSGSISSNYYVRFKASSTKCSCHAHTIRREMVGVRESGRMRMGIGVGEREWEEEGERE